VFGFHRKLAVVNCRDNSKASQHGFPVSRSKRTFVGAFNVGHLVEQLLSFPGRAGLFTLQSSQNVLGGRLFFTRLLAEYAWTTAFANIAASADKGDSQMISRLSSPC